jgi:hypothetical protein
MRFGSAPGDRPRLTVRQYLHGIAAPKGDASMYVYVLWATIYCINPGAHECDAGFQGPLFDPKKAAHVAPYSDGQFIFKTDSACRSAIQSAVVKDQARIDEQVQKGVTSVWSPPKYECRKTDVSE